MYYLYILQGNKKNWRYIGITDDLSGRLIRHNRGDVRSTKAYRPLQIVYHEVFSNKTLARKRELFLKKTAKARKDLFENIDKLVPSSNG